MKQYKPLLSSARANSMLTPVKIKSQYFVQAHAQRCNACPNQLGNDTARARKTGLLTDDIANGSSNTHAVERWHMLAAALIVG